jgi:hypothetical protein
MRSNLDHAAELVAQAQEAQARLGTDHLWVLTAAGVLSFARGDSETAVAYADEWLARARERDDPYEISHALILLSGALFTEPERAIPAADEAIRVSRTHGIASALLYALIVRGSLPADVATAMSIFDEATDVAQQLGDRHGGAVVEAFRGTIASREGDWPLALRSVVDAVTTQYANDPAMIMAPPLYGIAISLSKLGDVTGSAMALGFVDAHYAGFVVDPDGIVLLDETRALLHEQLPADELRQLTARGAALDLREMIAYAHEAVASLPEPPAS